MELTKFTDWVAWAGIVLPLTVTAVSAALYIWLEFQKQKNRRYDNFYTLMDQIGQHNSSIASKMAAISELKRYPECRDVIVRLCSDAEVLGADVPATMLRNEFELTARHFGAHRSKGNKYG